MATKELSLDQLVPAMRSAAILGMSIIWKYQSGARTVDKVGVKAGDGSLVTEVDHFVQANLKARLRKRLPGALIYGEEGAHHDVNLVLTALRSDSPLPTDTPRFLIMVDPVDGTRPLTLEVGTSTVIVAAYDLVLRQIVAVVIGPPADWTGVDLEWRDKRGTVHSRSRYAYQLV